jgi:Cupredoxin-like domain
LPAGKAGREEFRLDPNHLQMRMIRNKVESMLKRSTFRDTAAHAPTSFGICRAGLELLLALLPLLAPTPAQADEPEIALVIRNHRFEPAEVKVPAGLKVKLVIHNQDASAEEFESATLRREKLVPAGQKVVVYIGPLKAGSYPFIGEFNQATAQGRVVAE